MDPLALLLVLLLGAGPIVELTPPECDFGVIEPNAGEAQRTVLLTNHGTRPVRVALVSTCDCLTVDPPALSLPSGSSEEVVVRFDPVDDEGPFDKDVIIRTDHPQLPKALYRVFGEVRPVAPAGAPAETGSGPTALGVPGTGGAGRVPGAGAGGWSPPGAGAERLPITVDFYFSPGCRSCRDLLARGLPEAAARFGLTLEIREHSILDPGEYAAYLSRLERLGAAERVYPALILAGVVLQGDREIEERLPRLLEGLGAGDGGSSAAPGQARHAPGGPSPLERLGTRLAALPVLAAGLLDGINPCAFTTLIFLISALAVAGRSRREVLWIGLFFTLAVFATYLGVGLGIFQALRMASVFPVLAQGIRWALVAALLLFAALSLYDFFLIRAGRTDRVVLQLPRAIKRRIHHDIRQRTRSAALVSTALVLGFLVSVFELACTGQVYFPTIVYVLRVRGEASALPYLLLYNLGFVVPLLAVFAVSYCGVSSQAVTAFFRRSAKLTKLALAVLFLGLAVLMITT